jgi:hypothetical protein
MNVCNETSQNLTHLKAFILCDIIHYILPTMIPILLHIMHIPVIILIILTFMGKENQDAKWFVFHTAIFNLIVSITWQLLYIFPEFIASPFVFEILMGFTINLSQISIFPLAFTRFFFFYFQSQYEKIFAKKNLFWWILGNKYSIFGRYDTCGRTFANGTFVDGLLRIGEGVLYN